MHTLMFLVSNVQKEMSNSFDNVIKNSSVHFQGKSGVIKVDLYCTSSSIELLLLLTHLILIV